MIAVVWVLDGQEDIWSGDMDVGCKQFKLPVNYTPKWLWTVEKSFLHFKWHLPLLGWGAPDMTCTEGALSPDASLKERWFSSLCC